MFRSTLKRQGSRDGQSSGDRVHGKCLFAFALVHDAVINFSVDAAVGVLRLDVSEHGVQADVLGHVEEIGGRLKEGVEVVRVGHFYVDEGARLRNLEALVVGSPGFCPDIESVGRPFFPIQNIEVVCSGPYHEEHKVADPLGLCLEEVVLVAGLDAILDADGRVVALSLGNKVCY